MKKLLISLCVLAGTSSLMAMKAVAEEKVYEYEGPSGKTVWRIEEGVFEIRDAEGNVLQTLKSGTLVTSVRFTEDGKMIITEKEGKTRFYDAETGEEIPTGDIRIDPCLAAEAKTPVKEVGIQLEEVE